MKRFTSRLVSHVGWPHRRQNFLLYYWAFWLKWRQWRSWGSNLQPHDYKSCALPLDHTTSLRVPSGWIWWKMRSSSGRSIIRIARLWTASNCDSERPYLKMCPPVECISVRKASAHAFQYGIHIQHNLPAISFKWHSSPPIENPFPTDLHWSVLVYLRFLLFFFGGVFFNHLGLFV